MQGQGSTTYGWTKSGVQSLSQCVPSCSRPASNILCFVVVVVVWVFGFFVFCVCFLQPPTHDNLIWKVKRGVE